MSVLGNLDLQVEFMPPPEINGIDTTAGASPQILTTSAIDALNNKVSPKRKHESIAWEVSPFKKRHLVKTTHKDLKIDSPDELAASSPQRGKTETSAISPEKATPLVPQDSTKERRRKIAEAAMRRLAGMKID